jgi:hypothetical protein
MVINCKCKVSISSGNFKKSVSNYYRHSRENVNDVLYLGKRYKR